MPSPQPRKKEGEVIDIFISAYDAKSWKDAKVERPERTQDNAVDAIAVRGSDGMRLAIEHTIIEPFVGEKGDLAHFWPAFENLQGDKSLLVADRITRVFVPVGILDGQKSSVRHAIVNGITAWLKANVASLPEDWSKPVCEVDIAGKFLIRVVLNIQVLPTPHFSSFRIARQQVSHDLDKVVEKALRKKLPKLLRAEADRRILMLEREHMNLLPEQIIREIDKLRLAFRDLQKIDEIWLVETPFL